jgi:DtxR family Mn-dependent transcriptional regulator
MGWEDVYQEACSLEHATSNLIAEKLAQFLDNPEVCPHGNPIPKDNRELPRVYGIPLAELEIGRLGKMVSVISESNTKFLHYLTSLGLIPGAEVKVLEKAPFDGTLTIEVNDSTKAVGPQAASFIMVEPF